MEFESLAVGNASEWCKTVTETDVVLYAGITGDFNPVHINAVAASQSAFGARIAHGMLTAGFISAAIANGVPGPGAIYLTQSLTFRQPVRIGDTICARVEILEIHQKRRRVRLATVCRNQDGAVVLDGEAVVLVPAVAAAAVPSASHVDSAENPPVNVSQPTSGDS